MSFIKNKFGINLYDKSSFDYLKESGNIANTILNQLVLNCVENNSPEDLNKLAEDLVYKFKVKAAFLGYNNYPASVCISYNEKIVHGVPGNYKLKLGDVVSIDFGVVYKGHYSDNARTIIVGGIENEHSDLLEVTKRAFLEGLSKAYIGNTIGDIGFAIHKEILKIRTNNLNIHHGSKYKLYYKFQGHGIGMELHEEPGVPNIGFPGKGIKLEKGMCICIEPVVLYSSSNPINIMNSNTLEVHTDDKKPSSHHENQIYISEDGPIIISQNFN